MPPASRTTRKRLVQSGAAGTFFSASILVYFLSSPSSLSTDSQNSILSAFSEDGRQIIKRLEISSPRPLCDNSFLIPERGYNSARSICKVPIPDNYTLPLAWPERRFRIPGANVYKVDELAAEKAKQGWIDIAIVEDRMYLDFSMGRGTFGHSKRYLAKVLTYVPENELRTVLDMGAGVGNFAHGLLGVIPSAQVLSYTEESRFTGQASIMGQRGLSSLAWEMTDKRFPAPCSSFDLVHCSWCWHWANVKANEGLTSLTTWFMEVDRLVRPGGYFVWFGSWSADCEKSSDWHTNCYSDEVIAAEAANMGWETLFVRLLGGTNTFRVYQKPEEPCDHPSNSDEPSPPSPYPACPAALRSDSDSDANLDRPLPSCRTCAAKDTCSAVKSRSPLSPSARAKALAARLKVDVAAVDSPWHDVTTLLIGRDDVSSGLVRNVLDVGTRTASFAAVVGAAVPAMTTINVLPTQLAEYLAIVVDRGFIGLEHDLCKAFPAYPRSQDMVVLHELTKDMLAKCPPGWLFFEAERLLRPKGLVLMSVGVLVAFKDDLPALGWNLEGATPHGSFVLYSKP